MNYVKSGDVCSIHARIGWQGLTKKEYLIAGDYYLVTGVDFLNGNVDFRHCYFVSKDRYEQDVHIQVEKDDVLVTKDGTIGKVAYIAEKPQKPATLNSGVFVVRPQSTKQLLPRYLKYALESNHFSRFIESIKVGCTIPHLNQEKFLNYRIALPSLVEQMNVIEQLDIVYSLLSKKKSQISMMDELVKSRFVEMFGELEANPHKYMVTSLQTLIDHGMITYHLDGNHGGDYPRSEEFSAKGVPYIGANCIVDGRIDFRIARHLPIERANILRKGIAKDGDVLFAHNATVGPVVVLETQEPKVILSTSLTAYRCNTESINPYYLSSYMLSDGFVKQYSAEMKQTTRNQVPITAQKKYLFMVPPIELQEQFAAFVAEVDKSKLAVKQSLEKLETLKKSLMQQYFG